MTECVTPDGFPYTTSYATCPPLIGSSIAAVESPGGPPTLPQTGLEGSLAPIGLTLVVLGVLVRRIGGRS